MLPRTWSRRLLALAAALAAPAADRVEAQVIYTPNAYSGGVVSPGIYNPGIYNAGVMGVGGYGFGYGYPGYGFGFGYPGYGFGYGTSWGFGYPNPYGYGYGYGLGAYGMSPYTLAESRAQLYALNASRYNLMNAQAEAAYQAANLYQQTAINEAAERYRQSKVLRPGYDTSTAHPVPGRPQGRAPEAPIPMNRLFGRDGEVIWPNGTPSDGDLAESKRLADEAIRKAVHEYRANGRASVASVVEAKNRLTDFGGRAYDRIKGQSEEAAESFRVYLQSFDRALDVMGNPPPKPGSTSVRPDNDPKSGGDVLRESIRREGNPPSGSRSGTRPEGGATPPLNPRPPGDAPESTARPGDVP